MDCVEDEETSAFYGCIKEQGLRVLYALGERGKAKEDDASSVRGSKVAANTPRPRSIMNAPKAFGCSLHPTHLNRVIHPTEVTNWEEGIDERSNPMKAAHQTSSHPDSSSPQRALALEP